MNFAFFITSALAQNTAFTYQGRLTSGGNPANGSFDFSFQVFDAASGGSSLGGTASTNGVAVSNGLFTVTLDFGASPFNGTARWLQMAVSTNGAGSFTTLSPRQPLTPAPYANYSHTAGTVTNGAIGSSQLAGSSVAAANVQNSTLTAAKIAPSQVVKSLNALKDDVTIAAGANVTINTMGNSLQISAPAGGLALPYSGSVSTSGSAFSISNSLTGDFAWLGQSVGVYGSSLNAGVSGQYGTTGNYGLLGTSGYGVKGVYAANGNFCELGNPTSAAYAQNGNGNYALLSHPDYGVDGVVTGTEDVGVRGYHPTGNYGQLGTSGYGVVGVNNNVASGAAVYGQHNVSGNYGYLGRHDIGAYGVAATSGAVGVVGAHGPTGNNGQLGTANTGVYGQLTLANQPGSAVRGQSWSSAAGAFGRVINHFPNGFCTMGVYGTNVQGGTIVNGETHWAGWFDGGVFVRDGLYSSGNIVVDGDISGTSFHVISDRNRKENLAEVSPGEVLSKVSALPIARWNLKGDSKVQHIGPMAQDFHAAFGLGVDNKHIGLMDAAGVALAAIQGLNQKVEGQRGELEQKQTEITELKQRLEKLEQLITGKDGGAK